jgi:hypothetical protein
MAVVAGTVFVGRGGDLEEFFGGLEIGAEDFFAGLDEAGLDVAEGLEEDFFGLLGVAHLFVKPFGDGLDFWFEVGFGRPLFTTYRGRLREGGVLEVKAAGEELEGSEGVIEGYLYPAVGGAVRTGVFVDLEVPDAGEGATAIYA